MPLGRFPPSITNQSMPLSRLPLSITNQSMLLGRLPLSTRQPSQDQPLEMSEDQSMPLGRLPLSYLPFTQSNKNGAFCRKIPRAKIILRRNSA